MMDRIHILHLTKSACRLLRMVLAAVALMATAFQGYSFCFCDQQPQSCQTDGCGDPHRHDCHSSQSQTDAAEDLEHLCPHLELQGLKTLLSSGSVSVRQPSGASLLFARIFKTGRTEYPVQITDLSCSRRVAVALPSESLYLSKSIKVLC